MAKSIRLLKLSLLNFKGVRKFVFEPNGNDAKVSGDNGTGKTTIADAVSWLLFDKDSQGKKDFEIKTLDENNKYIRGLSHEVEAVFDVDGTSIELTKCYEEKYTKKRGSSQSEFTGHSTGYHIDGVPKPKREYEAFTKSLVDEDIFKLITSPTYFNELHWAKKRELLLRISGDVSMSYLVENNPDLADLPKIIGSRSIDDHKKVVASRRKSINKRLDQIPPRIDELSKSLDDESGDPEKIQREIKVIDDNLLLIKSDNAKAEITSKILSLNNDYEILTSDGDKERREQTSIINSSLSKVAFDIDNLNREIKVHEAETKDDRRMNERKEKEMNGLRADWLSCNKQTAEVDTSCPTCSQSLPEEKVQSAIETFNTNKAKKQRLIDESGKYLRDEVESTLKSINIRLDVVLEKTERISDLELSESKLREELTKAESITGDIVAMDAIKKELAKLETDRDNITTADTSLIEKNLSALRMTLAKIESSARLQHRIDELLTEEKELSREFEELENETFIMEKFIVAKVEWMEDIINSAFELAKFKLFKKQINGGIEETCETIYDGVPFSHGLNNGARIAVGMDIARTFQHNYSITAPMFVDNAESITRLPVMNCQLIKLVVDENEDALKVEVSS